MGNLLKNDLQKNDMNYNTTARKEIIIATGGNEKINDDNSSIDSKPKKYLAFGDNDYGIISYLKEFPVFKQLFVGNFQAFGFSDKDNKYYSFGLNSYGQLGQGTPTNYIRKNSSVKYNFYETFGSMWELTYINYNQIKTRVKFNLMSFGDGFSVASDTQNNIYTWGRGEEHQLGFELTYKDSDLVQNIKCRLKPTLVFNSSYDIVDLQCGKDFTFMHNSNKQVYAWGNNNDQQIMPFKHQNKLDTGKRYSYKKVENIIIEDYEFKSIKCGWSHTVALTYDNKAFIWGKIEENDSFDDLYQIISDKQAEFTEISSGFSHVILKAIDDKLYAFGDNRYGQCGQNSKQNKLYNKEAICISDFKNECESIITFKAGSYSTFVLLDSTGWINRELWVCGHNYNREIGEYEENEIDRFVKFGHMSFVKSTGGKIKNIHVGNGITILEIEV